jgi:DNA-directed RNA polymerase subunit RPC12/RpoP
MVRCSNCGREVPDDPPGTPRSPCPHCGATETKIPVKTYDLRTFIEKFVLPDLQKMIELQLHYYAFGIMCQTIEVMGSIFDQKDLDDYGAAETRFDNAITKLFRDKSYREKQKLFYSVLRGPLIHQLRPGTNLFLSSEKKDKIERKHHLQVDSAGRTVLVVEQFYADLIDAFSTFCRHIEDRSNVHTEKLEAPFVCVTHTSPEMDTSWWSKDVDSLLTITPAITGRADP